MKQAQVFLFGLMFALLATGARAVSTFDTITAGVDISSVATWVGTIGVAIVGIALGFKGIALAKRGISKV